MRYCAAPGCSSLVPKGRCQAHQRHQQRTYDQIRGTAAQRGYDSHWGRYRARFLAEHWYCGARPDNLPPTGHSRCLAQGQYLVRSPTGRPSVVDHIIPVSGPDDPRFYDPTNHQHLCWECHQRKRQREAIASGHFHDTTPTGGPRNV